MVASSPRGSSPDAVVIGGGIIGVATAAHLAERGRRVVLLERSEIAAGASGRNSGVVQHPFDPVLVDLHLESVALYRRLEAATDGALRLPAEPAGLLSVTDDPSVAAAEAAELAVTHPSLAPTYLDPAAARALEPALAPDVAACRLAIGYPVGPATATRAYAAWARHLGVDVRIGVDATPVIDAGRALGVRVADGPTIAASDVVVAAGPWSPGLVDPTDRWRPIRPLWGVVVVVGLGAPPRHVLEEAASAIPIDEEGAAEGDLSFSLITAEGASSLGSAFLDAEPDAPALIGSLVARGARFVPGIAGAPIGPVRACARPLTADGRPLIGRVPGVDGLWLAAGHGPWGISTGPASARLAADLVTGAVAMPPASLDPGRFGAPAG